MESRRQSSYESLLDGFYIHLNLLRQADKKKFIHRDIQGEELASILLQQGITTQDDPRFNDVANQFNIISSNGIHIFFQETTINTNGNMLSPDEAVQFFSLLFDEMLKVQACRRQLLSVSTAKTHLSFAVGQQGARNEHLMLLAVATCKPMHLKNSVFCNMRNNEAETGFIFGGKLNDSTHKPYLFVIDQMTPQQIVVGPNLIVYDQKTMRVRIMLPDNYLKPQVSQTISDLLLSDANARHTVSVYGTDPGDNSFQYLMGCSLPQDFNLYANYQLLYHDLLTEVENIRQIDSSLTAEFNRPELFLETPSAFGHPVEGYVPTTTSSSSNSTAPVVRSTRAMQIRQNAIANKQQQLNRQNTTAFQSSSLVRNSLASSNFNMQNQKTPQANQRASFLSQVVNNIRPSQLNFANNNQQQNGNHSRGGQAFFVGASSNNTNSNVNAWNNQQQNGVKPWHSKTFNATNNAGYNNNPTQTTPQWNNQNQNPFHNASKSWNNNSSNNTQNWSWTNNYNNNNNNQGSNQNWNTSNTSQGWQNNNYNNCSNGTNNSNGGGFRPTFNFSNTNNNNGINTQWNSWNNNNNQNQNWNASNWDSNRNQNGSNNNGSNFNNQPTIRFKFGNNSQQGFQPTFTFQNQNNGGQSNGSYNSQNPFAQNWNNNQKQNENQQQLQQAQPASEFQKLSLVEQEQIKDFLRDLCQGVDQDQAKAFTIMMLTNPRQFCEFYWNAKQTSTEAAVNSKPQASLFALNRNEKASKHQSNQNLSTVASHSDLGELDLNRLIQQGKINDLHLFLLMIPQRSLLNCKASQKENNKSRYKRVMERLQEGKITAEEGLFEMIVVHSTPTNEAFAKLYDAVFPHAQPKDVALVRGSDRMECHKLVLVSCSKFFKEFFKEKEQEFIARGQRFDQILDIQIPMSISPKALNQFVYFMYHGHTTLHAISRQMSDEDLRDFLICANFFDHKHLQELLIAKTIIPRMTSSQALMFYKTCKTKQKHMTSSWLYLEHFCQFFISKHLPEIIRANLNELMTIDSNQTRDIIDHSFNFLVDQKQDLETILQFAADIWGGNSISFLLKSSVESMESCSAFDYQLIPQFEQFLQSLSPDQDYKMPLINSIKINRADHASKDSSGDIAARVLEKAEERKLQNLDSTFIQGARSDSELNENLEDDDQLRRMKDLSRWKPSSNVHYGINSTTQVIFKKDTPTFDIKMVFESIKQELQEEKGISTIYRPFDFGRRSWQLKIDIDRLKNVSIWLVERGALMHPNRLENFQVGLIIPIKFSSILFQFEVVDSSVGQHKAILFHSFCHDHNQVVGIENFINLNQLQDQSLTVNVYMKDYLTHSSLMHYMASNFDNFLSQDLRRIKSVEIAQDRRSSRMFNTQKYNSKDLSSQTYDTLKLPFYTMFQMLQSNELNVEHEDKALTFLFQYSKIQSLFHSEENMRFIVDMLSQTLRFPFLSTQKMLSIFRDSHHIRNSTVFPKRFVEEVLKRIKVNSINIKLAPQFPTELAIMSVPRTHYDLSKLSIHALQTLNKQNPNSFDSKQFQGLGSRGRQVSSLFSQVPLGDNSAFMFDLIDWLMNSKHNKQNSTALKDELERIKRLYGQEKEKVYELQNALERIKRNGNLIYSPRLRRYRKSLSLDVTQDKTILLQNNYGKGSNDLTFEDLRRDYYRGRENTPPNLKSRKDYNPFNDRNYLAGGYQGQTHNYMYPRQNGAAPQTQ